MPLLDCCNLCHYFADLEVSHAECLLVVPELLVLALQCLLFVSEVVVSLTKQAGALLPELCDF